MSGGTSTGPAGGAGSGLASKPSVAGSSNNSVTTSPRFLYVTWAAGSDTSGLPPCAFNVTRYFLNSWQRRRCAGFSQFWPNNQPIIRPQSSPLDKSTTLFFQAGTDYLPNNLPRRTCLAKVANRSLAAQGIGLLPSLVESIQIFQKLIHGLILPDSNTK